ncbi:YqaA family protein [Mesorhizobium sp. VK24D]|uniref:YqaA family protein n=1 Tax=Mesorhizobium album TaxID=3072314 RepID=A0ABU4XT82_9HYPH|nr:YqaA family protein [Mesorhizobium sp. VK24D]MDX8477915.1 YqaA family protein [Mesorhizobium sp. VK24D]
METLAPYGALFVSAFVAATFLPAQSELVLAGLLAAGRGDPGLLLVVGTIGNTAGSVVNWAIGRGADTLLAERWFGTNRGVYERAVRIFHRYGQWSLLFAWLPVVGDALTLIAGGARVRLVPFVAFVGIGKAARYGAIIAGLAWWT